MRQTNSPSSFQSGNSSGNKSDGENTATATIIRMISENLENELNAAIIKDFCTKNAFADYDAVNLEAMAHETIVHTVMNRRTTATQEYKVTDKVVQLLHILGKKTAKYEIQSDEVAPHREGLKQATFSASKDSPWPPIYFALLGVLGDHEEDDDVNLLDYITNGDAISWDTAVSDFVKFLKSSPTHKPAIGKRKRFEAQFLHFHGFSDDN